MHRVIALSTDRMTRVNGADVRGMMRGVLTLHPWNIDFAWQDHSGPFRRLVAEQVSAFDRDGYLVVPDVLENATLAGVVAAVDGFEARADEYLAGLDGGRLAIAEHGAITSSVHLVAKSALLARYPLIVDLCADLIGPDVNVYWDQAVYKKPAKPRRFPWHQDNGYAFVEPQQYLTVWLALTDATVDNGCPGWCPVCTAPAPSCTTTSTRSAGNASPIPTMPCRRPCPPAAPSCSPRSHRT